MDQRPTRDDLARSVQRAADAGTPIAVVEIVAPGEPFTPSRGTPGTWYVPEAVRVRDLMKGGAADLRAGMALYPSPGPGTDRVIVLPLDGRNWLPYSEELERVLSEIVGERGTGRSKE